VLSSSQRDPVGELGSGPGRNALGNTIELIAAFTDDWSESRCGLKPGPIESMAMMICVAFGGGGVEVSVVSVLCGAGGGLTVQPETTIISADSATTTRGGSGTLFRVSGGPEPLRQATSKPEAPRQATSKPESLRQATSNLSPGPWRGSGHVPVG
jgi:hypothetical protein